MRAIALRAADRCPDPIGKRIWRRRAHHWLTRSASRMVAALCEWRRRAGSRAELAKFDGRMLRDIGLTPADAWAEINKPFWRE